MAQPRRALVTGAATGLGREIALDLARTGYEVAFADYKPGRLDEVMAHPDLANRKKAAVHLDLASEESIREGFNAAVDALGGLEILVNSAARSLLRPAEEVSWDEWNTLMDVNLRGPFFLCGHMARHCIAQGKPGAIVCLSSTHGSAGLSQRAVYGISKGGINQMMRALAIEWVGHGIRVNAVSPTTVMTEARKAFLPEGPVRDRALSRIPTRRFPEPNEVTAAVRYLVSEDAVSVTGHILNVDGGLLAE